MANASICHMTEREEIVKINLNLRVRRSTHDRLTQVMQRWELTQSAAARLLMLEGLRVVEQRGSLTATEGEPDCDADVEPPD